MPSFWICKKYLPLDAKLKTINYIFKKIEPNYYNKLFLNLANTFKFYWTYHVYIYMLLRLTTVKQWKFAITKLKPLISLWSISYYILLQFWFLMQHSNVKSTYHVPFNFCSRCCSFYRLFSSAFSLFLNHVNLSDIWTRFSAVDSSQILSRIICDWPKSGTCSSLAFIVFAYYIVSLNGK